MACRPTPATAHTCHRALRLSQHQRLGHNPAPPKGARRTRTYAMSRLGLSRPSVGLARARPGTQEAIGVMDITPPAGKYRPGGARQLPCIGNCPLNCPVSRKEGTKFQRPLGPPFKTMTRGFATHHKNGCPLHKCNTCKPNEFQFRVLTAACPYHMRRSHAPYI